MSRSARTPLALLSILVAGFAVVLPTAPAFADPVTVSGNVTSQIGALTSGGVDVEDADGEQVDSASFGPGGAYSVQVEPGSYTFSFWGEVPSSDSYINFRLRDVAVSGPITLDASIPEVALTVHVVDDEGQPVVAPVLLHCAEYEEYDDGAFRFVREMESRSTGTANATVWGFPVDFQDEFDNPDSGCWLTVHPAGQAAILTIVLDGFEPDTEITVAVPEPMTVAGTVTTARGPVDWGEVTVLDTRGQVELASATTGPSGEYELSTGPGQYRFKLQGWREPEYDPEDEDVVLNSEEITVNTGVIDVTSALTLDAAAVPVTVTLVGADGQPASGTVRASCYQQPRPYNDLEWTATNSVVTGSGEVVVSALPAGDPQLTQSYCTLTNERTGDFGDVEVGPEGADVTFVLTSGAVIQGDSEASVDGDGVPDLTEALGPNEGDGNGDGTPDHQQAHVTSLPANGAASGAPETYLTLAGPSGSSLVDVETIDPATVTTSPPPGVTLPSGLVSFALEGVPTGSEQKVSVYVPSTEGVTDYAKYDTVDETWSLLPAGRVQVFANRVEITLTDGGIGDADGEANGTIVDPGGLAGVTTQGDTTPPVVTGTATRAPNASGWYASNVRVRWTAVDAESGVGPLPPDTVVSGEGGNLVALSAPVCDLAQTPNCTTGRLEGLRIDRSAPTVAITGVTNGATYTLGAAPTPTCAASDALSGLARACTGSRSGGNANGVGQFTYTAAAMDNAGNRRTVTATYRVGYRFDGFLQPINDPDLSPGTALSVFRAGSTVTVAMTVKRASGQAITPVTAPIWVTPVRGGRTSAPVNETTSSVPGSSGTAFVLRSGRWQYNWSTRRVTAGYVYRIGVRLDDGTTHYVSVGVR